MLATENGVEDLLGVETKLFAPADYNGVIEGLLGGNLDMAWLGASGYAKVYLTDPVWEPDETKWRTVVRWPVK